MNSDLKQIIQDAKGYAMIECKNYGVPSWFHVSYAAEMAYTLAERLNANTQIVLIGAYLMDIALGRALKDGKAGEHVQMAVDDSKKFLSKYNIEGEDLEKILACVKEHHGGVKFSSFESEIVCNADCYKFLSVKGVVGGFRTVRDMELDQLVALFKSKADEKWQALTLDVCRKELESDYNTIVKLLDSYK